MCVSMIRAGMCLGIVDAESSLGVGGGGKGVCPFPPYTLPLDGSL